MHYDESKKVIEKKMRSLAPVHNLHGVFRDFTTLAACSISNSVDKANWQHREDLYMKTVERYTKDEAILFGEMLGALVMGLNGAQIGDLLGETFMSMNISNDDAGQFFTTYDVAKMMADIKVDDAISDIENNGHVTVNDPAVGGGVTIIAMAVALRDKGYNYQKCMKVICNDVDHDLVRLCYIQLSLLGIDAVVMQGDSLTQKMNDFYYTPIHLLNIAEEQKEKEADDRLRRMKEVINLVEEPVKEPEREPVEAMQLSLF